MGETVVQDPRTGLNRIFTIEGKTPTPEELSAIESQLLMQQSQGSPQVQPPQRSRYLPQSLRDLDPLTIGGPAMLGGALAAPLGPPGIALGASLGAALGSTGRDLLAELGRRTGLVKEGGLLADDPSLGSRGDPMSLTATLQPFGELPLEIPGSLAGPIRRAAGEGALELIVPQALSAVARIPKHAAVQAIAKRVPDSGMRLALWAEQIGVPLGAENIVNSSVFQGVRNTLGRLPFMSKHFRELDQSQAEALRGAKAEILTEIAPWITSVTDLGAQIGESALRKTARISARFANLYEGFFSRAERAGVRIIPETTRQAAADLIETTVGNLPTHTVRGRPESVLFGPSGEALASQEVARSRPIDVEKGGIVLDVVELARELTDLDTMTPRQYQTLSRTLNGLMDRFRDNPTVMRQATLLKQALSSDLDNLSDPLFAREILEINRDFHRFMELLRSPTGRRIAQAEGGLAGQITVRALQPEDRLFQKVFDTRSPQAMTELFQLTGPVTFRKALRGHIEDVFEESYKNISRARDPIKAQVLEIGRIRKALGIGRERSAERATIAHALDLSRRKRPEGVTIRDMERFLDVAEAALSQKSVDVSTFLSRRFILSGPRQGARILNPANIFGGSAAGGAAGGLTAGFVMNPVATTWSLATGLMVFMAARRGTRLLTDRDAMRAATGLLRMDFTPGQGEQLAMRVSRMLGEDFLATAIDAGNQVLGLSPEQASALSRAPKRNLAIGGSP